MECGREKGHCESRGGPQRKLALVGTCRFPMGKARASEGCWGQLTILLGGRPIRKARGACHSKECSLAWNVDDSVV